MFALGIVLLVIATGLIVGEFFTGSGLLFGGGLVALIVGLVLLFTGGSSTLQVNWWAVSLVIILVLGFLVLAVLRIINTYHRQPATGKEELKGKTAEVRELLNPEGTVFYQGELWAAVSDSGRIEPGEEVIINKVEGLKLRVIKKTKE
jgi:membrane-bound serine protease (ClpP class)